MQLVLLFGAVAIGFVSTAASGLVDQNGFLIPENLNAHLENTLHKHNLADTVLRISRPKVHSYRDAGAVEKKQQDKAMGDIPLTFKCPPNKQRNNDESYHGTVHVGEGDALKSFSVTFDTGSDNFWLAGQDCKGCLGSGKRYNPPESKILKDNNGKPRTQTLKYGSLVVKGTWYKDTVELAGWKMNGRVLKVEEASYASGAEETHDGLMGLGFSKKGRLNFIEGLVKHEYLEANEFCLAFGSCADATDSSLSIGGPDISKMKTHFTTLPLTVDNEWRVNLDAITVDGEIIAHGKENPEITPLIDTGTAMVFLPAAQAQAFHAKLDGVAIEHLNTGVTFWVIPCAHASTPTQLKFGTFNTMLRASAFNLGQISTGYAQSLNSGTLSQRMQTTDMCMSGVFSNRKGKSILGRAFLKSVYTCFSFNGTHEGKPAIKFAETVDGWWE